MSYEDLENTFLNLYAESSAFREYIDREYRHCDVETSWQPHQADPIPPPPLGDFTNFSQQPTSYMPQDFYSEDVYYGSSPAAVAAQISAQVYDPYYDNHFPSLAAAPLAQTPAPIPTLSPAPPSPTSYTPPPVTNNAIHSPTPIQSELKFEHYDPHAVKVPRGSAGKGKAKAIVTKKAITPPPPPKKCGRRTVEQVKPKAAQTLKACPSCPRMFKTAGKQLQRHIQKEHNPYPALWCNVCCSGLEREAPRHCRSDGHGKKLAKALASGVVFAQQVVDFDKSIHPHHHA